MIENKAPWETKAGKEETKLEMIDALIKANNPQEALSLIAEMRKTGSEEVALDVLQGKALRRLGLFDDADEILRDAIKHHPREASAHNELGLLLLERKEVEAALPELKTAAKQQPDNPDFLNNYGFALLSAGKPDAAVVPLRAALRLDGTRERTRNNLGFALVANGKPDEAYRLFRSSQTEADARYNVGYGLELEGEREKALVEYHSALASNPRHESATEGDPPTRPVRETDRLAAIAESCSTDDRRHGDSMKRFFLLSALAATALSSGCIRPNRLQYDYGRAYSESFTMQTGHEPRQREEQRPRPLRRRGARAQEGGRRRDHRRRRPDRSRRSRSARRMRLPRGSTSTILSLAAGKHHNHRRRCVDVSDRPRRRASGIRVLG